MIDPGELPEPPADYFLEQAGAFEMTFKVDAADREAINQAIQYRLSSVGGIPDAHHDDATTNGRVLAEICRGWLDLLGLWPPEGNGLTDSSES